MTAILKKVTYWKTYLILAEIALLVYFALNIVSDQGISGNNFILAIVLTSALFNTFFLVILSIFDNGSYEKLNKIGKILAILNFLYTSLVFSDVINVGANWIPALISTFFVAGLSLQFYIGLGNLHRIKFTWVFRLNSFLIILLTFYGIFLFILKVENGIYHSLLGYGLIFLLILSLASNLFNIGPKIILTEDESV